jgi:hypothetical protein
MSAVGGIISEFHIGFRKTTKYLYIYFKITMTDKNFSTEMGTMNWLFADLQTAFDTVVNEALL